MDQCITKYGLHVYTIYIRYTLVMTQHSSPTVFPNSAERVMNSRMSGQCSNAITLFSLQNVHITHVAYSSGTNVGQWKALSNVDP